ncbi:hypothetical protein QT990_21795 [Microcoleus sp. T3_B1]|uniref:hypothetical protein n=1 Tax=Microcoleus sp. T3_B1 TaxID=3055425 RepID=UPI002FD1C5B0
MAGHPFPNQYLQITKAQLKLMSRDSFGTNEVSSVALALEHCADALKDWDLTQVKDDDALHRIDTIKRVMDTTNVKDDTGKGLFYHRARVMTLEERDDFSNAVFLLLIWLDKVF